MLRWMCGVTKLDRISIKGTANVGEISKKVQESRLKWYGNVLRREEEELCGQESDGDGGAGERRRGRLKLRWLDSIRNDFSGRGVPPGEEVQDRAKWRRLINHQPSVYSAQDQVQCV